MTIVLHPSGAAVAEKNRSIIPASLSSDWLRFSFHTTTGAATAYDGKLSGSAVSGTITLDGTVTNIWDNVGWVTPQAGAGNAETIAAGVNAPFETFFRPDTMTTTPMLILYSFLYNGTPDNGARIFSYGVIGARGGWVLDLSVGANINFQLQEHEVGAAATVQSKKGVNTAGTTDTVIPVMHYMDGTTNYTAKQGDWSAAGTGDISSLTRIGTLTNDGIGFLCNTDFAGTVASNKLNADIAGGNEAQIHNLTFVRASFTQAELTAICSQHAANPREMPWGLEGK